MKKKTCNVAVLGAGAIGVGHIAGFQQHPAARIVALAETAPERNHPPLESVRLCYNQLRRWGRV